MTSASAPIGILIVDDHPLLRDGLAAMIRAQTDMVLLGEAEDGAAAITSTRALRPDVILMDIQMPHMDGVEAIAGIRAFDRNVRVIVLTTYSGDVRALRALEAGANAYLLKDMVRRDLLDTIREIHAGKRFRMPGPIAESIAAHVLSDALSQRETEVLSHVASGRSNREIGIDLGISEQTVKAHMKSILGKLDARDRTHAVTLALRRGILVLQG